MNSVAIDSGRIEAMLTQLRAAASKPVGVETPSQNQPLTGKVNFADVLKSSLDQVNTVQKKAEEMGQKFALGDDKVSLSDVMISIQKSSISLQATVQVRNKLVSAYHEIMNMQV